MNMASLGPYSAYQTPMGAFYSPVPTPTQPQSGSFQHATGQSPPLPQSQDSFGQILNRLNSLDKRLEKLDSIEKQLTNMNSKISNIDLRVSSLESSSKDISSRLTELEATRAFDTSVSDEISRKQAEIDKTFKSERDRLSKLKKSWLLLIPSRRKSLI